MNDTAVATRADHARPGRSASGRPRQPWILDGYAPAGGVLTTVADLARLCGALLDGSAPGVASLRPLDGTAGDPERPMGMFWLLDPAGPDQETESDQETRQDQGSAMVWHNGATGGYSAFLALWPEQRRAVAVLADQARAEDQQRIAFDLAARPLGREERPPA
jgi:CubicO group peptidase (beta-lactamase class C family)